MTENCKKISNAIYEHGAFLSNIVGFIGGTMQQICCPTDNEVQNLFYNGWKHVHSVKFRAISTPDSLTSSVFGPYTGSNNDQGMFNSSNLMSRLNLHFEKVSPKIFSIYGDEAYSISKHITCPFPKATMNEVEESCNKSMSKFRVAIEMEFGKIVQYFSSVKFKYLNRVFRTKPALKYFLATVFKNIHTCLLGSAVISMFGLDSPTLEEYILGLMRERNEKDTPL